MKRSFQFMILALAAILLAACESKPDPMLPKIKIPKLLDYEVHIPPGGKTDALVETTITWEGGLKTRGVDTDQLAAAIEATVHAVNLIAMKQNG